MKTNFAKTTSFTAATVVMALATLGAASSFAANAPVAGMGGKSAQIVTVTEGDVVVMPTLASTRARAEVRAEYLQAVKNGQIVSATEAANAVTPRFVSTRARDEVRAEAVAAAHNPSFPIN